MVRTALLLALLSTFVPPAAARRKPRLHCEGPFAKSCVRRLYRCFDAAGGCSRDINRFFDLGTVTDCWENGARATITGFGAGTTGTTTLTDSAGKTCRIGTNVGLGSTAIEITYVIGNRRRYVVTRSDDGAFTVRCPRGNVEEYSAEDVATFGCGPIADCPFARCP
jgi:hypothetical protein